MSQKTMKAIVIYEAGGPEKLVCTEVPVPEVRPGWSLVRILVRGGTSGVGIAFVRLVKSGFKDVQVMGTTRNLRKAQALLDEG